MMDMSSFTVFYLAVCVERSKTSQCKTWAFYVVQYFFSPNYNLFWMDCDKKFLFLRIVSVIKVPQCTERLQVVQW